MNVEIRDGVPASRTVRRLREVAGLTPITAEAARRGLPNTIYGAYAVRSDRTETGVPDGSDVVGMGRLVGDDGCFYQVVDVAVVPEYQGRGIGTRIMERLMDWLEDNAPPSAYVSLVADVQGFYERFGFDPVGPDATGMALRIETNVG